MKLGLGFDNVNYSNLNFITKGHHISTFKINIRFDGIGESVFLPVYGAKN